jgi:hypothetical protein
MLKGYPDWFLKNEPRPEQRLKGFTVWYYHRKETPLLPAGLLGPVQLVPNASVVAAPKRIAPNKAPGIGIGQ